MSSATAAIVVSATFTGFALLFIFVRSHARYITVRRCGVDDGLIIASWILSLMYTILETLGQFISRIRGCLLFPSLTDGRLLLALGHGFGQHTNTISQTDLVYLRKVRRLP